MTYQIRTGEPNLSQMPIIQKDLLHHIDVMGTVLSCDSLFLSNRCRMFQAVKPVWCLVTAWHSPACLSAAPYCLASVPMSSLFLCALHEMDCCVDRCRWNLFICSSSKRFSVHISAEDQNKLLYIHECRMTPLSKIDNSEVLGWHTDRSAGSAPRGV